MTDSQQPKKKQPTFNEDAVLRGAWRRAFLRFPMIKEILIANTRYVPRFNQDGSRAKKDSKELLCNVCKQWVKASFKGKNNVQVDHIVPVIDITDISGKVKDWNLYKARLVCDKSNLQIICTPCHDIKTKLERDTRSTLRDRVKLDEIEKHITYAKTINEEKQLKKDINKFLTKTKTQETKARAAKLKELLIQRLTKED